MKYGTLGREFWYQFVMGGINPLKLSGAFNNK